MSADAPLISLTKPITIEIIIGFETFLSFEPSFVHLFFLSLATENARGLRSRCEVNTVIFAPKLSGRKEV